MKKRLASILVSLVALPMSAQIASGTPQLVVGITIDQLRGDYLEALQPLMSETGFKLIMQQAVVCDNVIHNYSHLDKASTVATIHTGTTPFYNGIISEYVFDRKSHQERYLLHDDNYMGNGTDDTYSAMALKVSTLSDEVKLVNKNMGRVYSVAPDATMAILAAGHISNSALWIDDASGRWVTTTYYYDAPSFAVHPMYLHSPVKEIISNSTWAPLHKSSDYTATPYQTIHSSFIHTFSAKDADWVKEYKTSPFANTCVTDMSIDLIKRCSMGKRGYLDMLNIGYTLAPYNNGTVQEYPLELQDAYVRLDAELSRLLAEIDKSVGLDNVVLYVTSTGYFSGEGREKDDYKLGAGEFYPHRAISLLNMYLMAMYGNGDWVLGFDNNQIYLNRELIKENSIDLNTIREQSAQFLMDMEGVHDVHTYDNVLLHPNDDMSRKLRASLSPKYSGDVFIEVTPGWEIVYDSSNRREYVRYNAIKAPFMLMAPNLKAQKIDTPIDATAIAPTISEVLHIRSPNGCSTLPINIED